MSLRELFRTLKDNPSGHTYTALRIQGRNNAYVAVNSAGQPALLVETDSRATAPSLRTARVSLRPSEEFNVFIDGKTVTGRAFHTLVCESSDQVEVEYFLILLEAFLASQVESEIVGDNLFSFFRSMIRLFSVTSVRNLDSERQGLWGELFVMRQVRGYRCWAPYWHSEVTRLFDFSTFKKRVEVKTTVGTQRIHHFSHNQIWEAEGEQIVIASLLLMEDDAGLSLRELVRECRKALHGTPDYLKLEFAVRCAGMEDPSLDGPRFNESQADKKLAWFKSTDTPHFLVPEPPGVSETKYKVNLTAATPLSADELDRWLNDWTQMSQLAEVRSCLQ